MASYDANSFLFLLDHVYGGKDIHPEIKVTKYGGFYSIDKIKQAIHSA